MLSTVWTDCSVDVDKGGLSVLKVIWVGMGEGTGGGDFILVDDLL